MTSRLPPLQCHRKTRIVVLFLQCCRRDDRNVLVRSIQTNTTHRDSPKISQKTRRNDQMEGIHIPCLSCPSVRERSISRCSDRLSSVAHTFFFPAVANPPHSSSGLGSAVALAPRSIGSATGSGSGGGGSGSALPFFPFYARDGVVSRCLPGARKFCTTPGRRTFFLPVEKPQSSIGSASAAGAPPFAAASSSACFCSSSWRFFSSSSNSS